MKLERLGKQALKFHTLRNCFAGLSKYLFNFTAANFPIYCAPVGVY
jgi:hypothetical protein